MKSSKDPEFEAWTRRQFAVTTAAGGAALLGCLWPRSSFAQAQPVGGGFARHGTELELDALAANHPHLHMICTEALAQLKYAFTVVASGKHSGSGNEFAEATRSFIAARKPRTKAAYAKGANALLAAPKATREEHFSRYAAIAPGAFVSTRIEALPKLPRPATPTTADDLKVLSTPSSAVIDKPDAEAAARKQAAAKNAAAKKAHDEDVAEGKKYKQLEFFITEVKCIENTGGLLEGTDEIAMGGLIIGRTGKMEKIKQFNVKDGFDTDSDSNTKRYRGGRQFGVVEIHPDAALPHEYVVTIAMAELDSGGFGDLLAELWTKVKNYVTAGLATAGGAIAGALSLSWLPGIGTMIGATIGAFIGWLASMFHNDDDIVGHKTRTLRLHHTTKSYYDKLDLLSPKGIPVTMDFTDEGHYRVTGGWRLVKP